MIKLQLRSFNLEKYHLSNEFKSFLETLLKRQENSDFSQLCRLHFQINGGKETSAIEEVFKVLDLFILIADILDDIEDEDIEKWRSDYNLLVNGSTALIGIILLELQEIKIPYQDVVLRLFFKYLLSATDGQHHDLKNLITSEEMYIDVVKKKSGSLISLSSSLGQILATGKSSVELRKYAQYVSIVAQIKNDYEDLLGEQKDLLSKKRTLPILYLLQYEDEMFDQLRDYYNSNKILNFKIDVKKIEDSGLEVYINFMISKYRKLAIDILKTIYPGKDLSKIKQLI